MSYIATTIWLQRTSLRRAVLGFSLVLLWLSARTQHRFASCYVNMFTYYNAVSIGQTVSSVFKHPLNGVVHSTIICTVALEMGNDKIVPPTQVTLKYVGKIKLRY